MQHVCKKVILQESNKGKCQYANTKFLTAICQMRLLYTFIIKKRLMKLQVFFWHIKSWLYNVVEQPAFILIWDLGGAAKENIFRSEF